MTQEEEARAFRWLCDNIGKWEVRRDGTRWTRSDGTSFVPGFTLAADGTLYAGYDSFPKALKQWMSRGGNSESEVPQ